MGCQWVPLFIMVGRNIVRGSKNDFSLAHINIRSLKSKIETLRIHMLDKKDAVLGISESWLHEGILNNMVDIDGYNLERLDRSWGDDKKCGGVAIFIRKDLSYSTTSYKHLNISSNNIEVQWVEIIRNGKKNIVVANVYRPPDGDKAGFIEEFNSLIGKAFLRRRDLMIMGDFNIDYLSATKVSTRLMKICLNILGLRQIIDKPTRSNEVTATCLDWVITNTMKLFESFTRTWNLSDHLMVGITLIDHYFVNERISFEGRTYKKYNADLFKACIKNADWGPIDNCNDVNERWLFILGLFTEELDKMCPVRTFKVRKDRAPWITDHILELINDKDKALKKAISTKNLVLWQDASRLRNSVNKSIRKAKAKFIRDSLEENQKDSKKFWRIINGLVKGDRGGTCFKLKDTVRDILVEDGDTPEFINDFFLNIGPNLAANYNEPWFFEGKEVDSNIGFIETEVSEVTKYIKEIDTSKSSCIDGISSTTLKDAMMAVPDRITYLFNESIVTGRVPELWKVGTIVPLQKDGDRNDVSNLRPVTLLPIIGKLLEKIINNRLMNYLESNNILEKKQGGFRAGHSTIDTVGYFVDEIYRGINFRHYTLATFVDLKKAFDTVNHSILLEKLSKIGVGGLLHAWLKDYLSNRKQCTSANGRKSSEGQVLCGVPQGSILGPTLFLVYINDLSNIVKKCGLYLYADDTAVCATGPDLEELTSQMEADLVRLAGWFKRNKLTLNAKKTNYMIFGLRNKLKEIHHHSLRFGDVNIDRVLSVKYLGIILDPVLNFNKHAESTFRKIVFKIFQLAFLRESMTTQVRIKMYKTMVLPHMDYGDVFYGVAGKFILDKLQVTQNKALRMCLNVDARYPTILAHQEAEISSLAARRQMHVVNFMFKQQTNLDIVNNRAIFTRAHDAVLFLTIKPRNETTKKSLIYRGAMLWNALSVDIRNIESYEDFKLNRKKWLGRTNYM